MFTPAPPSGVGLSLDNSRSYAQWLTERTGSLIDQAQGSRLGEAEGDLSRRWQP
jgi:hypothetical protein